MCQILYVTISTRMEKLAGQTNHMTGRNAVAGNGNGNGNSTADGVTDRYYLGKASVAKINSVEQLVELQSTCEEVMATYKPLVTEYQQALETANPRANVAEATRAFHRHLERLIKNQWLSEDHSLATLKTEVHATIQQWWSDIVDEEFEDDQKAPNEGAPGSAETGDEDHVLKQSLGMGSKETTPTPRKNQRRTAAQPRTMKNRPRKRQRSKATTQRKPKASPA